MWLRVRTCNRKNNFLISKPNICCVYSKEPSQWDGSFEHPKHMLKLWVRTDLQLYMYADFLFYLNLWVLNLTYPVPLYRHFWQVCLWTGSIIGDWKNQSNGDIFAVKRARPRAALNVESNFPRGWGTSLKFLSYQLRYCPVLMEDSRFLIEQRKKSIKLHIRHVKMALSDNRGRQRLQNRFPH